MGMVFCPPEFRKIYTSPAPFIDSPQKNRYDDKWFFMPICSPVQRESSRPQLQTLL